MYDVYGDLVIVSQENYSQYTAEEKVFLLTKFILLGYKKIFTRSRYQNDYRVLDLTWISPYPRPDYATTFLTKEGEYFFYGDLTQAYYTPRYHYERVCIKERLLRCHSKDVLVIGSGISPYSIYLSDHFKVSEVQPNQMGRKFGLINLRLNKKEVTQWQPYYHGEQSSIIVSMIPTIDWEFHKGYNFKELCIFYALLDVNQVSSFKSLIQSHYGATAIEKKVRDYSKTLNVYRFELER